MLHLIGWDENTNTRIVFAVWYVYIFGKTQLHFIPSWHWSHLPVLFRCLAFVVLCNWRGIHCTSRVPIHHWPFNPESLIQELNTKYTSSNNALIDRGCHHTSATWLGDQIYCEMFWIISHRTGRKQHNVENRLIYNCSYVYQWFKGTSICSHAARCTEVSKTFCKWSRVKILIFSPKHNQIHTHTDCTVKSTVHSESSHHVQTQLDPFGSEYRGNLRVWWWLHVMTSNIYIQRGRNLHHPLWGDWRLNSWRLVPFIVGYVR